MPPALDKAKQAAAVSIESGAGVTGTVDILATTYGPELLALEQSSQWRAWRARWINCAAGIRGKP